MSLDASLKAANALVRHRNVLTRDERLAKLKEEEKWQEGRNSVFGLPKVAHRKQALAKAAKEEAPAEGAAAGAAGAAAPAAAGAAPAAGAAKGAAPAKGAAAAPAAKAAAAPAKGKK